MTKKAYFVDGYHGGIKGHMPLGSWADVFNEMKRHPHWKISLDIEPISWEVLKNTDPISYETLQEMLKDNRPESRVEMLAGSYAQPFGWVINGESNIRHLMRGLEIIKEHFPEAIVDTYATQEPCWSSAFPQILLSLGFKRAVLKNPGTAWGGYAAGHPEEIVYWVGPDGSKIPCIPRYECEDLVNCWETEAAHMKDEFIEKCMAQGISHPIGSFLQDLGWPANPAMEGREHVDYVTWREYFEHIIDEPTHDWHFTQEDILCTLPWGEATLQKLTQEVKAAENIILQAEKMATIAGVHNGYVYPIERFQEAWDELLLSQHHDAWICATTQIGRRNWAWQAGVQSFHAESISVEVMEEAMNTYRAVEKADQPHVKVFNTLGYDRKDLVSVNLPLPVGTKAVRVFDQERNEITAQVVPSRNYREDGSINAGEVLFQAEVPAMGYDSFVIVPLTDQVNKDQMVKVNQDIVTISTDVYEMSFDLARGGVMTKLYHKVLHKDFVRHDEQPFNEYRAYFIEKERWVSSTEKHAEIDIQEDGPLRAKIVLKGTLAHVDVNTTISVLRNDPVIDFQVHFHYEEKTWIGDPWDIEPECRRTERRKSHHNDQYKLRALFPVALKHQDLYKNAAFDVTKSKHKNTQFTRWDEIKHTIILDWVDIYDPEEDIGFAIYSDHTTGYSHDEDGTLGLVLGWGWEGGFWWGKCPLEGHRMIQYSILPHAGNWEKAKIEQINHQRKEPLQPMYTQGALSNDSLLKLSDPSIQVVTALREDEDTIVRLYNPSKEEKEFTLTVHQPFGDAKKIELDGRWIESLERDPDDPTKIKLSLHSFGIATIKLTDLT